MKYSRRDRIPVCVVLACQLSWIVYIYILVLVFSCCIDCSELYIHVICGKDCGVVCSVSFNVSIARKKNLAAFYKSRVEDCVTC